MKDFRGYQFDVGEQEDSSWNQYLNVLYSSLEDLERIANMDLQEKLVEQGDVLTVPREVQHWMSFSSEPSRAPCPVSRSRSRSWVWDCREHESDGGFSFGISIIRTQPIEQTLIDQTVIELRRLCLMFNGDYEGWETPVITQ